MRVFHFLNRTYEQLQAVMYALHTRYRVVRLFHKLKNGLFYGYFEVDKYIKKKKGAYEFA